MKNKIQKHDQDAEGSYYWHIKSGTIQRQPPHHEDAGEEESMVSIIKVLMTIIKVVMTIIKVTVVINKSKMITMTMATMTIFKPLSPW